MHLFPGKFFVSCLGRETANLFRRKSDLNCEFRQRENARRPRICFELNAGNIIITLFLRHVSFRRTRDTVLARGGPDSRVFTGAFTCVSPRRKLGGNGTTARSSSSKSTISTRHFARGITADKSESPDFLPREARPGPYDLFSVGPRVSARRDSRDVKDFPS